MGIFVGNNPCSAHGHKWELVDIEYNEPPVQEMAPPPGSSTDPDGVLLNAMYRMDTKQVIYALNFGITNLFQKCTQCGRHSVELHAGRIVSEEFVEAFRKPSIRINPSTEKQEAAEMRRRFEP